MIIIGMNNGKRGFMKDDRKVAHLEMIQKMIIKIMDKSFVIKGWTITVEGILLAMVQKNEGDLFLLVLCGPI